MHLVPDRRVILSELGGGDVVHEDIKQTVALFLPVIEENKRFLVCCFATPSDVSGLQ